MRLGRQDAPATAPHATLLPDGSRPAMVAGRWAAGEEHLCLTHPEPFFSPPSSASL